MDGISSESVFLNPEAARSRSLTPAGDASGGTDPWPVAIFGIPFDPVSCAGAVTRIESMIASRKPHYIVTANVDFLVQARGDIELRRILIDADLVLCDGTPLVWASRWLGNALPERVAGSDLTPSLLGAAAERGHRVFFLGAAPGIAAEAAARLQRQYPTLQIVGHYSPPVSTLLEMDHASIIQAVRASRPDIPLVSFGCPKQEKWIAMHFRTLGVPVCIGVGATLDFLAGRVKRAPVWMRRSGCEWIFRLLQEPRRLYRRYAIDLCGFVPAFAAQWWRMVYHRAPATRAPTAAHAAPDLQLIDAGVALTRASLERHALSWRRLSAGASHCILDLGRVEQIDATGVAFLVKCRNAAQQHSRQMVLVAAPAAVVRATLEALRLAEFFTFATTVAEARQSVGAIDDPPVLENETTPSIAWRGEIIAANIETVWQTTARCVRTYAATGAAVVSIDLARLRFIDSSAAGLMLRLKKWAQSLRVDILFERAPQSVRNVLHLAQLDHLLEEEVQ